jgi:hypothetical protein
VWKAAGGRETFSQQKFRSCRRRNPNISAVEGAGGCTFDAGFTTPDGTLFLADAKRTALIHKGTPKKVCDPEKGQRHAVEAGDNNKAKL